MSDDHRAESVRTRCNHNTVDSIDALDGIRQVCRDCGETLSIVKNRPFKSHMSPAEFSEALKTLDLGPRELARIIGCNEKAVRDALNLQGQGPTAPLAFAVRGMLRNFIPKPSDRASYGVASEKIRKRLIAIAEDAHASGWGYDVAGEIIEAEARRLKPELDARERDEAEKD